MNKKVIEVYQECEYCGGTGLYAGFAEKDDCAVVCRFCKGKGSIDYKHEYIPFTGKKQKSGVSRVFKGSFGYGHSSEDIITKEGKAIKFSQGGVSYSEWLKGGEPKPVKELYCPFMFMSQDLSKHPTLKKHCSIINNVGTFISECPQDKKKCWELWEKDNKQEDN